MGSFNRPKAISCLATHRNFRGPPPPSGGFNRPKAISCLATRALVVALIRDPEVSIARRRLVVLRHSPKYFYVVGKYMVSIARRRLVVLRLV